MRRRSLIAVCAAAILASVTALGWTPSSADAIVPANEKTVKASVSDDGSAGKAAFTNYLSALYETSGLGSSNLDTITFRKAIVGYLNLRKENVLASTVLTIVDFNRPSTEKRMWIIDVAAKKLLFNNYVAHGQGSGDNLPANFSNVTNSHQSSLGFYVTASTYQGKHGLSLKLKGLDEGFNTNAESRAIVLHGADYVSESFIAGHGRLGRSHGCPAVPAAITSQIIQVVKGKSCMYINGPSASYTSRYLDEQSAYNGFSNGFSI